MNRGWAYRDRVGPRAAGLRISIFYSQNYPHSNAACWRRRIADGEIELNGVLRETIACWQQAMN